MILYIGFTFKYIHLPFPTIHIKVQLWTLEIKPQQCILVFFNMWQGIIFNTILSTTKLHIAPTINNLSWTKYACSLYPHIIYAPQVSVNTYNNLSLFLSCWILYAFIVTSVNLMHVLLGSRFLLLVVHIHTCIYIREPHLCLEDL